ncbi:hypothetical protein M436DRAFT_48927 [Aureobasidium namibiae CBS 147.97]|uniref:Uncharacterized protein n=1 Tax=Aureobasidium namibiae CBS 147.97 TaxID=1043004 RepID=A0A074WS49_9PEZI|nr:uncharacterized protein M436DRAFT_48927 [Aureobasidium namibiae CBS 147.97]KEQ72542.1 hypothetical protein M436DRAFT_48927 [Aureobasidium namibiae CBS 147.97]
MSINLDVDMEDAPPGGPREFTVPDPPQKPGFIHGVDNVHWSQSSRRLAAQLNHDKTGFDVKLYDPSDPTARGLDPSISPWYRLGPPSNIPDYPPLLEKYSVQMLEAAGFLNHDTGFDIAKINGRLAFAPWRNYHRDPDLQIRIHPVLRRDKWLGITDYQYSLMLPSLLLASAILDDPITLNYFCALSRPSADMKTVKHVSAGLTADCKIMEIPATLSYNDQQETYNKFILMTTYLESWSFEDVAGPIFGLTGRTLGVFGQPERASKL